MLASEDGNHPRGAVYVQAAHTCEEEAFSEFLREKSSFFMCENGISFKKIHGSSCIEQIRIPYSQKMTNAFEDLLW